MIDPHTMQKNLKRDKKFSFIDLHDIIVVYQNQEILFRFITWEMVHFSRIKWNWNKHIQSAHSYCKPNEIERELYDFHCSNCELEWNRYTNIHGLKVIETHVFTK